ncbi:MAG: hypothetical protein H7239_07190 [Flavobacterium sp.]|nr:hypothetical protein [Flavobacterium sp.]
MCKKSLKIEIRIMLLFLILLANSRLVAQVSYPESTKSDFWNHVQFGGGFGVSAGSGYTDFTLAPSAIYNFNEKIALGAGLQGSYISAKNQYTSTIYGANVIGLFNPIEEIQLSLELEEVLVNSTFNAIPNSFSNSFWNTGLFVGAGYRTGSVTIGARYNLLFNKDKNVYSDALMPFVRIYF